MAAIANPTRWPGRHRFRVPLLGLFFLVATGCSSTHFLRVDPKQPVELAPGEALIAFQVDSDLPLDRLVLTGLVIKQSIPSGRHFWIARMEAGDYSWRSVQVADGPYQGKYQIQRSVYARPGELDFEVLPGHLNYAGELIVRRISHSWRQSWISVRIRNHAAEALRRIIEESPTMLDRLPIHTAGTSGDRFLEFYLEERGRLAATHAEHVIETSPEEKGQP